MKRTLLDDFIKIYKNINCDSLYCNCNDCSNKRLCDLVEDVIKNIGGFYNETKKNFTWWYRENLFFNPLHFWG